MASCYPTFTQGQIEACEDDDTMRLVQEYDPESEFVVMLLKHKGRTSTYRIRRQPRGLEDSVAT
jgi:hypothetical protein